VRLVCYGVRGGVVHEGGLAGVIKSERELTIGHVRVRTHSLTLPVLLDLVCL
jgi:hypothetical protein